MDFKATKKSSAVQLNWQTADEQNSDKFIIEHSKDGQDFLAIGEVTAKGLSTSAANNYTFQDSDPEQGNNYYRLKMVDKDGSSEFSSVQKIYNSFEQPVTLYPNPAGKLVAIAGISQYEHLIITDIYGKILIERTIRQEIESIDVSTLSGGIYLIQLKKNGDRKTLKFVKKE